MAAMRSVAPARLPRPPRIARHSALPPYQQIERWLVEAIASGQLAAGDRLPSERELAARLKVSRMTLRQSLGALESRGLIARVLGRNGGTFVREPRVDCDLTTVAGLTEQLRRAGMTAGARVLAATRRRAAPTVAEALGLVAGAPVHEIVRLRAGNGQPIALERSFFPAELFPDLLDEPLDGSLYALLELRYGLRPLQAFESVDAVPASEREARLLEVPAGAPLLRVERTAMAAGPVAVEYATDLFRSDRTRLVVTSGAPAGTAEVPPGADGSAHDGRGGATARSAGPPHERRRSRRRPPR
jgi:GntR family transcriptional regulator